MGVERMSKLREEVLQVVTAYPGLTNVQITKKVSAHPGSVRKATNRLERDLKIYGRMVGRDLRWYVSGTVLPALGEAAIDDTVVDDYNYDLLSDEDYEPIPLDDDDNSEPIGDTSSVGFFDEPTPFENNSFGRELDRIEDMSAR